MDGVASSPYLINFRNAAVAILAQVVRMADEYRTLGCDLAKNVAQHIFDDTVPATHLYPKDLFCAKLQPSKGKTSTWKACERALQTLSEIADHTGGRVPHKKSLHEQFVIYLGAREITWSFLESDAHHIDACHAPDILRDPQIPDTSGARKPPQNYKL